MTRVDTLDKFQQMWEDPAAAYALIWDAHTMVVPEDHPMRRHEADGVTAVRSLCHILVVARSAGAYEDLPEPEAEAFDRRVRQMRRHMRETLQPARGLAVVSYGARVLTAHTSLVERHSPPDAVDWGAWRPQEANPEELWATREDLALEVASVGETAGYRQVDGTTMAYYANAASRLPTA